MDWLTKSYLSIGDSAYVCGCIGLPEIESELQRLRRELDKVTGKVWAIQLDVREKFGKLGEEVVKLNGQDT